LKDVLINPVECDILAGTLVRRQVQPAPPSSLVTASVAATAAAASDVPETPSEIDVFEADPKRVAISIREVGQRLDSPRPALNSADARRAVREVLTPRCSGARLRVHAMCPAARQIE